jgi:putative membrane protein
LVKNWITRWIVSALALSLILLGYWVTRDPKHFNPNITPGIWVDTPAAILVATVALGLANSVIRPIILFFAWPINCLTFGLFSFALNFLLFWGVGNLGLGFHVNGPIATLVGCIAMGVLSGMLNFFLKDREEK